VKQHNITGKWIFRRAMRGILPDIAIDREKSGFGMPLRHWLRNDLRSVLEETITMRSRLSDHVDIAMLQSLLHLDRRGVLHASYPLFGALALDSWLRQFSDGSGVRETARLGTASYAGAVAECSK
jgi:asparagine synthase (glutamine-hydrolysing)